MSEVAKQAPVEILTFKALKRRAASRTPGWLWEGILPSTGVVLLTGAPNAGKSRLIATLVAAMNGPGQLAGRRVEQGLMFLISAEHRDHGLAKTLTAAKLGAGVRRLKGIRIIRKLDLEDGPQVDYITQEAERLGARVIVVDSFRAVSRADENGSDQVREVFRRLEKLGGDGKRTVVLIHHSGKKSAGPRGSIDFLAATDTALELTAVGDAVRLHVSSHEDASFTLKLRFVHTEESLHVEEVEASGASASGPLLAAVLRVITKGPRTRRGVRKGIREEENMMTEHAKIDAAVDELVTDGLVQNVGTSNKHKWVAVPLASP
jgi:hypothetical protein